MKLGKRRMKNLYKKFANLDSRRYSRSEQRWWDWHFAYDQCLLSDHTDHLRIREVSTRRRASVSEQLRHQRHLLHSGKCPLKHLLPSELSPSAWVMTLSRFEENVRHGLVKDGQGYFRFSDGKVMTAFWWYPSQLANHPHARKWTHVAWFDHKA